jgi:murein DD-endopeptidase MepM/ murein hydrolase activator NlpD
VESPSIPATVNRLGRPGRSAKEIPPPLTPSAYGYGPYDNSELDLLALQLRAFGHSERFVLKHAYAPFVIGGPAHWVNSWGALRHDPDGTIRRHLGQDVFCDAGAPILAGEEGTIEFGTDLLGGLIARLNRKEGGYFYYAHLQNWNLEEFTSGDQVSPGDVIGYCGSSGNASGGSPHLHFGYFGAGAQDPMGFLVEWEQEALKRAQRALRAEVGSVGSSELERRFGDDFVPDPIMVQDKVSGGSFGVMFADLIELNSEGDGSVPTELPVPMELPAVSIIELLSF